jgi:hypothetical protein
MTLQEQAKEVVERNKGNIKDTIKTIDQMLLIYTIINSIHNYEQISLDLSNLKICLIIELQKYKEKNKNIKKDYKDFKFNLYSWNKDYNIEKD